MEWYLDKYTLKLTHEKPDWLWDIGVEGVDRNKAAVRMEDEIKPHNHAMSVKMYSILNQDVDHYLDETLLSLKLLKGTHYKIATFNGPSVWLINSDTTLAIEVNQAFGPGAAPFNQVNMHSEQLAAKNAPLLFGSFLIPYPKPV
ncbi:hypothetical protein [Helicobacter suis]|uniref:Uncharacterized protein n=1 Tax=Helicobacter suis TaxID=104628 RepID=A0A6J4CX56_9HELI|nr:hypothetical protein [Helicobacter suis]BCD45581.1 hypothetical protein NHP190020_06200 [Helicobacter suis]BCD47235.1 hypothetical protein NHP194003_04390 [Helicobacter suis]BCD48990.1 hypothetical protein NHP194004_04370 [Helicobacter suis]BCD50776.1 hypothetical protein NHP194022_04470 [Helicobacter suis]BCD70107.1 hypothetical protein SNTW_07520 [Helicobacter suis]